MKDQGRPERDTLLKLDAHAVELQSCHKITRVRTSQLQRWDQRVREGRAVAAGFGVAQRDVGFECGAQRHHFQLVDQRLREKRAVAAGLLVAGRDEGCEGGFGRSQLQPCDRRSAA